MHQIRRALTRVGVWTARPWAFGIVGLYGAIWLLIDPRSFDLHAFATMATWLMTLLIQRAEHRDTQAIHAKLDELLVAHERARSAVAVVDAAEPEDIERLRAAEIGRTEGAP